jgi:hypothetical protein
VNDIDSFDLSPPNDAYSNRTAEINNVGVEFSSQPTESVGTSCCAIVMRERDIDLSRKTINVKTEMNANKDLNGISRAIERYLLDAVDEIRARSERAATRIVHCARVNSTNAVNCDTKKRKSNVIPLAPNFAIRNERERERERDDNNTVTFDVEGGGGGRERNLRAHMRRAAVRSLNCAKMRTGDDR